MNHKVCIHRVIFLIEIQFRFNLRLILLKSFFSVRIKDILQICLLNSDLILILFIIMINFLLFSIDFHLFVLLILDRDLIDSLRS